ncbi:MAG: response regulator [Scytonema sp. PMC 1069.18]|nr:response regulator [Scytonema sp. PMC 1069.18]MEC4882383.1 response regulator [Scytonema sp. PMC 1070.18]
MSTKRILIIDDEKNLCTIIKASLEKIGRWQVLMANVGSEGLLLAETELPDAILLDVMMPNDNGLTLLDALQKNPVTQKIPVVLLTAKVLRTDLHQFAQLDVAGVIPKPFDPLVLPTQVAEILSWK